MLFEIVMLIKKAMFVQKYKNIVNIFKTFVIFILIGKVLSSKRILNGEIEENYGTQFHSIYLETLVPSHSFLFIFDLI